jgi:hypothetical protein
MGPSSVSNLDPVVGPTIHKAGPDRTRQLSDFTRSKLEISLPAPGTQQKQDGMQGEIGGIWEDRHASKSQALSQLASGRLFLNASRLRWPAGML